MASDKTYGAWIEYLNNKKENSPNLTLHEFEKEIEDGKKYNKEVKTFYNNQKDHEFEEFDDWDDEDYGQEWIH